MSFESDEDRLALLADFGVDIIIGGQTVTGIFDDLYTDEFGVSGSDPTITVRTIDVASVGSGDAVSIGGVDYTARTPEPDGLGITHIPLRKV
jgi:hypothetical protein